MKTVVLGDPPPELASLLAQRKRLGLDAHDELWHGEYHMAPAASFEHSETVSRLIEHAGPIARRAGLRPSVEFNLGTVTDFRVPDLGFHRGEPSGVWLDTAAIVVEVRSPDDETFEKFDFYAAHDVDELLVVDLVTKSAQWYARVGTAFETCEASALLGVTNDDLERALGWAPSATT